MLNIGSFLSQVKAEVAKVVWPTKEEFVGATIVALIVIVAFAIFLSVVNYAFYTGAQKGFEALVFNAR